MPETKNYWVTINYEALIRCDEGHYRYIRDEIELAIEQKENDSAKNISMISDAWKKEMITYEIERDWGKFKLISLEIDHEIHIV